MTENILCVKHYPKYPQKIFQNILKNIQNMQKYLDRLFCKIFGIGMLKLVYHSKQGGIFCRRVKRQNMLDQKTF